MAELRVSPVTVQQALDNLVREGVLDTRPGQGTFVANRRDVIETPSDMGWQSLALGPARAASAGLAGLCLVSSEQTRTLNAGYLPEELQATALLAAASARALRRPGVWGRMPAEGSPALRGWFAAPLLGAFEPHEVTICPGTQAANSAAFRALAAPGDPVLVESPTYVGALAAAQAAGLRAIPVPMDAGKAFGPCAAQELGQHRLGLVVAGVGGGHGVERNFGQELSKPRIAQAAGGFLDGFTVCLGFGFCIDA